MREFFKTYGPLFAILGIPATVATIFVFVANSIHDRDLAEREKRRDATVTTGITIITLATTLALISHAGNGPPIRWCIPFQL